ncbi:MAG: hypothetical protein ACYC1T_06570 [Sulfuricaulis sp.]
MRHSLLLVVPLVLGVGGCVSTAEAPPTPDQPLDATVIWGNKGRGGAAGRVPGYVHALASEAAFRLGSEAAVKVASAGNDTPAMPSRIAPPKPAQTTTLLRDPMAEALAAAMQQTAPEAAPLSAQGRTQSHNPTAIAKADDALRRAWEKYCHGGAGMNDEEWRLVHAAGAPQNIPAILAESCVYPK